MAACGTKGIMDCLLMAACEWFLMFWIFVEAALAYFLTRFARYCQLQIPCLLCSRLDHLFGNEEGSGSGSGSGSCSYLHLLCKKHQTDISNLIYCNLHNELVDVREMCEDCSSSATLQTRSNLECYRFVGNQSSFLNKNCCTSHQKEKSTGTQPIWSNVIRPRASNVTAKPPLPRVGRHGKSKRLRNKAKHRHRNALSPVGQYPEVKFTSDSEFEFIFSDNDDGGIKVVGISERSLKNDMNVVNQYRILGRHTHSTPDLRSAFLLNAQHNEGSRTRTQTRARSASLTPNFVITRNHESDPLQMGRNKNPSSSSVNTKTRRSLDGSETRYKIFSRNAFSASDLQSALLQEIHNSRVPQRSASLTPYILTGHEHKWPKNVPPKVNRHKKLPASNVRTGLSNGYGYLDDSVVSSNKGNHHSRNSIPRRHSYSVFQLGGQILLNMPVEESQHESISHSWEDRRKSKLQSPEADFRSFRDFHDTMQFQLKDSEDYIPIAFLDNSKGYGSLDDLVVARSMGTRYQNTIPRRHSHTFFDLGSQILLNMPVNDDLATNPASFAPRVTTGSGMDQPNSFKFQSKPNPSTNIGHRRNRRGRRKSLASLNRTNGYESMDESDVSFNTGFHDRNNNPRRHSYSAFELGCALLVNMQPIDTSLTARSGSMAWNNAMNRGFGEPKRPGFHPTRNASRSTVFLHKNSGYGSLDDSAVKRNARTDDHNHYYNQNTIPRRHSYSILQLGGDILLNMPTDERLTGHSFSLAPKDSHTGQSSVDPQKSNFYKAEKDHNPLPPTGQVKRFVFGSSNDVRSDLPIDKSKWHGSFDDYLISRSGQSQSQSAIPRRHSHSAFDLGRAVLLEINLDNSLKNFHQSLATNGSTEHGHGPGEQHRHHHKAKRAKNSLPPPCPTNPLGSSSEFRNDFPAVPSLDDSFFSQKTVHHNHNHNHHNSNPRRHSYSDFRNDFPTVRSLDDSFFSQKTSSHNQSHNSNPRRHSYSAFELGCALLLNMHRDASLARRSASVTPKIQIVNEYQHPKLKKDEHNLFVDSVASNGRDGRKRSNNLPRNYYSVSDLTSPVILQMNLDESLRKRSASLTPDCLINQSLGELNSLKFQAGATATSHQKRKNNGRSKARKSKRSRARKCKKPLRAANNAKSTSSSTNPAVQLSSYETDDSDVYESFDDSDESSNFGSRNRYQIFSRNSQSTSDLRSVVLLETHPEDRSRNRSKSLTPNSSSYFPEFHDSLQFFVKKPEEKDHTGVEIRKKQSPGTNPIKTDLCPNCLDKIDMRSLDGSITSEIDGDGCIEKVKRQAEDDVRCMRLLQSELEAERNAATVAANHAMNMITRLQQEKASLQMEALQYLRMMEEQAEYDMEALQKANELVEEKENEIQDLLDELEQYRAKFGEESINNIKSFDEEKRYVLESLSKLEKRINQLSNGVDDESVVNENYVELSKLEHEISDMKQKMEALQADLDLIKHACNTLHDHKGYEFVQEIAHQLQDLRRSMSDRRLISSN